MPERSSVAQVSQIGPEVTPGTPVVANRRLGGLTLSPSIETEVGMYRPAGSKFSTVQVLNKEWTEVGLEGQPTYEEVIIPLSGAIGAATVVQVMDGATPTGAYEWTFIPASFAADAPKTFTLEAGQDNVQAEQISHLLFTEFGLDISRSEVGISGSAFGKAAVSGFDPTNALAIPASLTPIAPGHFSVYLVATGADLAVPATVNAGRLTRVVSVSPTIGDRYNPAWFLNAADSSFTTFVENADGASAEVGLTVEADAAGMAWLPRMRVGTTHFLRIEALGPVIYNAGVQPNLQHLLQIDMAVKVMDADEWSDEDGIYAIPWTLQPVHDATWGQAMRIKVRNKISAL